LRRVSAEASSPCLPARSDLTVSSSPPSGLLRLGRSLLFGRPLTCLLAPCLGRSLLTLPSSSLGFDVPCLAILWSPPTWPKPPLWSPLDVPSCPASRPKPPRVAFGRAQLSVPCPRHLQVPADLAEASSLVARRCALVPRVSAEASSRCLWTRSDLACLALATFRFPPFWPKPPLWSPSGVPSCPATWPKPPHVAFGRARTWLPPLCVPPVPAVSAEASSLVAFGRAPIWSAASLMSVGSKAAACKHASAHGSGE
jgi:hypothetical protein